MKKKYVEIQKIDFLGNKMVNSPLGYLDSIMFGMPHQYLYIVRLNSALDTP